VSIEIDFEQVIGVWSVELNSAGNMIAFLSRGPGANFTLNYRFRHYRDDKLGADSADVRHYYHGELTNLTEGQAIEKLRQIVEEFRTDRGDGRGWELIRGERSVDEFVELFTRMPGIHVGQAVPA
jgi:hypothetical protein